MGLQAPEAELITSEKPLADFFEQVAHQTKAPILSCHWITGELLHFLKEEREWSLEKGPVRVENFSQLMGLIQSEKISGKMAKEVLALMWKTGQAPMDIIREQGMEQITDPSALLQLVESVLSKHPDKVAEYKEGKTKLYGFFVGQIMKASKGQANPKGVNELLKKRLSP